MNFVRGITINIDTIEQNNPQLINALEIDYLLTNLNRLYKIKETAEEQICILELAIKEANLYFAN